MYGYSKYRSFKKFTPSRTTGVFNNRSIYRVQKVGNTYKKGTVKASYSKDEEKKYNDRAIGSGTITIAPNGAETSDVTSLAAGESVILIGDLANTKWRELVKAQSGASHIRGTFGASDLTYTFTIATPSVAPTAGAVYTNNSKTFTVVSYSSNTLVCTGTGYPTASGTLTKSSGTGDATLTFTAFTATFVITHNKALSAPYTFMPDFATSAGKTFFPDDVTGATNSATVDVTSLSTIVSAGTCGYDYL